VDQIYDFENDGKEGKVMHGITFVIPFGASAKPKQIPLRGVLFLS
jgi:hypothetical protein